MINLFKKLFRRREIGDWSILSMVNAETGEAGVIRLRTGRPGHSEAMTTAIEISWPFTSEKPFPAPDDRERMDEFERAIDELSGENGHTELMQVSTGHGVTQWLFYSANRDQFMGLFNARLTGQPRYQIEIKFYDDPRWSIWQETVEAVRRRQPAAN
jgi:hypothetical protein